MARADILIAEVARERARIVVVDVCDGLLSCVVFGDGVDLGALWRRLAGNAEIRESGEQEALENVRTASMYGRDV